MSDFSSVAATSSSEAPPASSEASVIDGDSTLQGMTSDMASVSLQPEEGDESGTSAEQRLARQQESKHLMSEATFRDPNYRIRTEVQDALIQDMEHGFGRELMTKIQQLTLASATSPENYSIRAQAQSGSGKTIAFILAILHKVDEKLSGADSLQAICCGHSRELVMQIESETKRVAGRIPGIRIEVLEKDKDPPPGICQSHIIIATPAMIGKYSKKILPPRTGGGKGREAYFNLDRLKVFVVDEADEQVKARSRDETNTLLQVMARLPTSCQVLLFSATYPEESVPICDLAFHGRKHADVTISKDTSHLREILHICLDAEALDLRNPDTVAALSSFRESNIGRSDAERAKLYVLQKVLMRVNMTKCIIFATTRETCFYTKEVAARMNPKIEIEVLTGQGKEARPGQGKEGGMSDEQRDEVVHKFRTEQECKFLAATNVIARGLDVPQVSAVVNFELPIVFNQRDYRGPKTGDAETYVHRVGRTGRIGAKGVAMNIVFGREESNTLERISLAAFNKNVIQPFDPNDIDKLCEAVRVHTFESDSKA